MSKMSNTPSVRYVRILIHNNDVPEWFTSTLCVRVNGMPRSSELSRHELEAKRQEAERIYGLANVTVANSPATSLQEAEFFFNNSGIKNADKVTS